jgi:hypothetical protein
MVSRCVDPVTGIDRTVRLPGRKRETCERAQRPPLLLVFHGVPYDGHDGSITDIDVLRSFGQPALAACTA